VLNRGKPPLGLMPKRCHDELRARDILQASLRYLESGYKIPISWIQELAALKSAVEYNKKD
jgi:hypothetical protein